MNPSQIVVHHEGASNGFWKVNEYHRQLWNFKSALGFFIGYQYYIDKMGVVFQGRLDNEEGAHTKGQNSNSIGICLEGNFNTERPTEAQLKSLESLIAKKMNQYAILPQNIGGHRMFALKDCPGKLFPETEVKQLFQPDLSYLQQLLIKAQQMLSELFAKLKLGGRKDKYI